MEEGRDCGRRDHLLYHETAVAVGRPPLARWFVGSFVSKWACTRFYQLCGPTSLARPPASSLRSRSKGERGKEGRVIHAKRCHHLSSPVSRSLPSIPLMGVHSASLLCGPQRWRAVLTNCGCSLLFWIDNPQVFHLFTFVPFITRNLARKNSISPPLTIKSSPLKSSWSFINAAGKPNT